MFLPDQSTIDIVDIQSVEDAAAALVAVSAAPSDAQYVVGTANGTLSAEQSLGALTTGLLKNTVSGSTGTLSTAVAGTDYESPLTFAARLNRSVNTIDLATTAVTPGSYTAADITVDAYGRITAAANGSGGGGAVSSVFGRTGAVTAATNDYTWAQIDKTTSSLADLTTRSASDLSSGTLPLARLSGITNTEISNSAAIAYSKLNLTGAILNADLAGSIANAKLANSSITIAGSATSLGGSITLDTITGLSTTGVVKRTGANTLAIGSVDLTAEVTGDLPFANFVQAGSAGFVGATGAGDYSHRTPTQVTAALDAFVGDSGSGGTKGLVPAPSAGDAAAGKVLGAGGTWVAGGSGITVGTTTVTSGTATRLFYETAGNVVGQVSGATSDGTNVTFGSGNLLATSPQITTGLNDANGNESILLTATGSAVNEITVANAATGNAPTISATGDDTNIGLTLSPKGTGIVGVSASARTGTAAQVFRVLAPADTALTASTESILNQFGGNTSAATVTRQFATGALTTQRENVFVAPTYAFVGASTLTNAATLAITGAPTAGTNATITNPYALWVQSGGVKFEGVLRLENQAGGAGQTLLKSSFLNLMVRNSGDTSYQDFQAGRGEFFATTTSIARLNGDIPGINIGSTGGFGITSANADGTRDTIWSRAAAANWRSGAADAASPVAQTLSVQNVVGGTSNTAGATWTLRGSLGTSQGAPGRIHLTGGAMIAASGTTQQTAVDRIISGATKVLTNNSAITLVNVTNASDTNAGGVIDYCVDVTDGVDQQYECGMVTYGVSNKGGVWSGNTATKFGNHQNATSGTLTVTFAISGANPALLSVNANSSLSPSSGYPRITYSLRNLTQQAVSVQ